MPQPYNIFIKEGFHVVEFTKALEQGIVEKVFRFIEDTAKSRKIILDLGKVDFVNSTFIGYMYHLFETSQNMGGYVCFVNCNPKIQDAFNLTGVYDIIPHFSTTQVALDRINKR